MIILEGPNKAGKSTLAARMKKEWGVKVLYMRDFDTPAHVWMSSLAQLSGKGLCLTDRCWITELVYHRPARLRLDQLYYLSLRTQAVSLQIILPPWKVLKERGMDDKEVYHRYKHLKLDVLKVGLLDADNVSVHDFLPKVLYSTEGLMYLDRKLEERVASYQLSGWAGVGSLHPKVLFIGDRVNPHVSKARAALPFVPVGRQSCGAYLMRVLYHAGLCPRDVHIHNALTPTGQPYDLRLVDFLKPRVVVALGDVAHEAVCGLKYPVTKLPHPQFLRRFHTGEEVEWARILDDDLKKLS